MTGFFTNLEKQWQLCKSGPLYNLKRTFYFYLGFGVLLLWISGCNFPGGQNRDIPQIQLTIQNTLPIKRVNVPIVLSLAELKEVASNFSFNAYLVVSGQAPIEVEIPSQADDTNYDGHRDALVFFVDLEPQETKSVRIRYAPDNEMAVTLGFARRTRAGVFPELGGYAALESEWAAYLLHPNGSIDSYGKKTKGLSLDRFVRQRRTPSDSDEEILTPLVTADGPSNGLGFGLWDTETGTLISPEDQRDYVRIVVDGPMRSVVQRIIPDWVLSSGRTVSLTSTYSIYAGHQWAEHHIQTQGLGDGYRIAIRLPNRGVAPVRNEKDGWVWNWETEVQTDREMGFGVIYPVDGFETFFESETGNTILMRPDQHDEVYYRFATALGVEEEVETETQGMVDSVERQDQSPPDEREVGLPTQQTVDGIGRQDQSPPAKKEVGIATEEAFEKYVQAMATEIQTPPVIQFTPQETKE